MHQMASVMNAGRRTVRPPNKRSWNLGTSVLVEHLGQIDWLTSKYVNCICHPRLVRREGDLPLTRTNSKNKEGQYNSC